MLSLFDTEITDQGLARLSQLSNLKELWLDRTRITDEGLGHLRNLKKLEIVSVAGTQVTLKGAKELRRALPWTEVTYNIP